jgi:uncharacterized membrane protein YcfT
MARGGEAPPSSLASARVDWVDYAKGWCIILVVMMHSTLGVEEAIGHETWLHGFIAWARPFRMPDFFLVAGLFLSRSIDRPWRVYLDRKVVHFAYFFVLWTLIQGVPKLFLAGGDLDSIPRDLAFAMIEPFGTLWFIYLLPVFFVATKFLRGVAPQMVLVAACCLQISNLETGSFVIDEFAAPYVYFYAGYLFAPRILTFAETARARVSQTAGALLAWAVVNAIAVRYGYAALPGKSLLLGFAGAAAVVAFSALLAALRALPVLRWLGARSIVVYLAFFLPMAISRVALLGTGLIQDGGLISLIVRAVAIVVPTFVQQLTNNTVLRHLFERPALFRLSENPRAAARSGAIGAMAATPALTSAPARSR